MPCLHIYIRSYEASEDLLDHSPPNFSHPLDVYQPPGRAFFRFPARQGGLKKRYRIHSSTVAIEKSGEKKDEKKNGSAPRAR
jgi:hypothetical protein